LPPGYSYIGEQDGIAAPCARPGEIYKSSDLVDLQVLGGATVIPYSFFPPMMLFQLAGGWKGSSWQAELNRHGDTGWDALFTASNDKSVCPCPK
jgi:hypothetical protein